MNLAGKLKTLRKERNVSQERLAAYLNVSFQAVSKWECGNSYPDITLLPSIARFFGITVDKLLQAEVIDEAKLYKDYLNRASELYRNGHVEQTLPLWQAAYHDMPNNIDVKEMLMSAYFDIDREQYRNEIIQLGTEIYNSDAGAYYKGQAIMQIAQTCAKSGDLAMAEQWASRAYQMNHSQEMIYMQILQDGGELLEQFRFANYWYVNELFYMTARLSTCPDLPGGDRLPQAISKVVADIYEIVYPHDDMSFESLRLLCNLHRSIAEDEVHLGCDEAVIRKHIERAVSCAKKSVSVEEHTLTHPLEYGYHVAAAPSDRKQILRELKAQLSWDCFASVREKAWFKAVEATLNEHLE